MSLPRSYLFVPGDRPERFDKARATAADAVVVDLEDAVAPAAKPAARAAVGRWLAATPQPDRVVVRINDASTPWFDDDLALLRAVSAPAVMLPKAECVSTIERVRAACPSIAVLALVETAVGVLAADALAAAAGVQRLVFGTLDYALDMGLDGELADTVGLDAAASRLALASRAAGIAAPVAGVTATLDDDARLRADVMRARAHGFTAKLCIHPRQVDAVHALFAPGADELAWARRVLDATDGAADGATGGAVRLDGRMVDRPVIERARRILRGAR